MKRICTLLCSTAVMFIAVLTLMAGPGLAFKPSGSVTVINHSKPGGGSDLFARAIVRMLEAERLIPSGWKVVNKSGGAATKAMAYLAGKKGDTNIVSVFTNTWVVTSLTRKKSKYTYKDFTPLARMLTEPTVAVVRADSPYKSMKDFVEDAKKNKKLVQVGGSISSIDNMFRQLIQKETGAKWDYVNIRRGGERIANLLGGHMQLYFAQPAEVGEHIRAGKLRIISTLTEKRLPALPNVSTIKEQGIDVPILTQVRGVMGPAGIGGDVVKYWEGLLLKLTKTASWKKYAENNQVATAYLNSKELGKFLDELANQLRSALKQAGVKVIR